MKKRILVCGGRDYTNRDMVFRQLENARDWFDDDFVIIHGGARGADTMANIWACDRGHPVITMHAQWDFYKQAAGGLRNKWMLQFGMPDLVIAFPGGPGTRNMVTLAKKHGIEVYEPI